ncbi:dienelactone hydrolase family protein [Anaerolineales bacterium HSG6]|nr:dienelactone hydrolase family protein [Anaerolineales bacterium HSG6]
MPNPQHPHAGQKVYQAGKPLAEAKTAMILLHGRGAGALDILPLSDLLPHPDMAYFAPHALRASWYPFSFLAPLNNNEPYLSSALQIIDDLVRDIEQAGIPANKLVLAGFSQGACLSSEYIARHPRRYGGVLVFSGGLIGPPQMSRDYEGSLDDTPIFLGCSDTDFHIPEERVHESTATFKRMGANVTEVIYPNMGHTIIEPELVQARQIVETV